MASDRYQHQQPQQEHALRFEHMFASNSNSTIYVSHSTDGGKTWSIVAASPTATWPNFVNQFSDLAIGSDGTVYLSYLNCPAAGTCAGQKSTMYIQKSTDGGKTWSKQVAIDTPTLAPAPAALLRLPSQHLRTRQQRSVDRHRQQRRCAQRPTVRCRLQLDGRVSCRCR